MPIGLRLNLERIRICRLLVLMILNGLQKAGAHIQAIASFLWIFLILLEFLVKGV